MDTNRIGLVRYRLEKANTKLTEASDNLMIGHLGLSITCSYYAIFSSIRALLVLKDENPKTHEGAIKLFNKYFVKDNKFPAGTNKLIKDAKDIREQADYGDFFVIERKTAEAHLEHARRFVKRAEEILTESLLKGKNSNNKK